MNYSSFISKDFYLHSYDKSNQLLSSTTDGKTTQYEYDAAGRMVKEGDKTYAYGYLDKILEVQKNGEQIAAFDYHVGGQIAQATHGDKSEISSGTVWR
ncbi:MAG: RHS repeat protein [Victivallaceae bacterium]|nr:RHS repeat protein [Victivallaceae bacterium]